MHVFAHVLAFVSIVVGVLHGSCFCARLVRLSEVVDWVSLVDVD